MSVESSRECYVSCDVEEGKERMCYEMREDSAEKKRVSGKKGERMCVI